MISLNIAFFFIIDLSSYFYCIFLYVVIPTLSDRSVFFFQFELFFFFFGVGGCGG